MCLQNQHSFLSIVFNLHFLTSVHFVKFVQRCIALMCACAYHYELNQNLLFSLCLSIYVSVNRKVSYEMFDLCLHRRT